VGCRGEGGVGGGGGGGGGRVLGLGEGTFFLLTLLLFNF